MKIIRLLVCYGKDYHVYIINNSPWYDKDITACDSITNKGEWFEVIGISGNMYMVNKDYVIEYEQE